MNSELKHSIHKHHLIAAIASVSLGFLTAVLVSNDTKSGYVSGWTWLGFLIILAGASLLLFIAGLCSLIIKREMVAPLILSSVLLTGSYLMTLYVMKKVGYIYYQPPYIDLPTNERSDKPTQ